MEKRKSLDNLDDLLEPQKDEKLKKVLLGSAVVLILLIIIILITKSFVEGESKNKTPMILPPEPVAHTNKPEVADKPEPLFEDVPIEEESKESPSRTATDLKKVQPAESKTQTSPSSPPVRAKTTQPTMPKKPIAKSTEKKSTKPKSVTKKKVVSKTKTVHRGLHGHYYIQVGAFFRKGPSREFLASIRRAGFHYTTLEGSKNGIRFKKLVVGPYSSRSAALKDLAIIKRRINQNAYIFRK